MPKSKGRKRSRGAARRPRPAVRSRKPDEPVIPPIDGLVRSVLRGGRELLEVEDPLEAELWASSILGTSYKLPIPLDARDELERSLGPAIVEGAERAADAERLAILRALAAVADGELSAAAHQAAERLAARAVPDPVWTAGIGRPRFVDAWVLADPYDDQLCYYATFRYPGRPPHTVTALFDENLGGIVKDAFAGIPTEDPRSRAEREPGARVSDAEPGLMAARIIHAIETGDRYLDNDWTREFKQTRALLLSRMRLLPAVPPPEPPPPLEDDARAALTAEFLASEHAPALEETGSIVRHCLDSRCDFGDGDPLRWSPIVVELFMLDYLPRKATLDTREIRALPDVLRGWVRFALTKRGLEERWVAEAEGAVNRFAPAFRRAVTDPSRFGPAKAIANAMLAAGVDLTDQRAVNAWIADFNARPQEAREGLLGELPLPEYLRP